MDLQGRTLAKRLKVRRRVKFSETWPLPMGVYEIISDGKLVYASTGHTARGPFRATKFFLTLSMALSGIAVLPSLRIGVTSTGSHSIGAWAALLRANSVCLICTDLRCCEDVFDGL